MADIILAVDEPIDATRCHGMQNCKDEQKCLTHDLWENLNTVIFDYLHSVSLAQSLNSTKGTVPATCRPERIDRPDDEADASDRQRRSELGNRCPGYLDYNATTPIAEPVLEAMLPFLRRTTAMPRAAMDSAPSRSVQWIARARRSPARLACSRFRSCSQAVAPKRTIFSSRVPQLA